MGVPVVSQNTFLSFISKSNSWRNRIHLINLGLASFLVSKYFKAA
jgi:hypothetical protein